MKKKRPGKRRRQRAEGPELRMRCLFCDGDRSEPDHDEHCDGRQGGRDDEPEPEPIVRPWRARQHARTTDPDTSHAAAEAVTDATEVQLRVLALLRERPRTDEELIEAYRRAHGIERQGEAKSSPRKRRSDLTRIGLVVDSGDRRPLSSGRNGIVWKTVEVTRHETDHAESRTATDTRPERDPERRGTGTHPQEFAGGIAV